MNSPTPSLPIRESPAMLNSVRIRLTLWYSAVLASVLVLLAVVTYFIVQRDAISRTDAAVVEQADSFLKTVDAEVRDPSGPENLQDSISAAITEHRFRDTLFIVVDDARKVLGSSDERAALDRDDDASRSLPESVQRISSDTRTLQTVRLGHHKFRSYIRKFTVERKDCSLIVLQSLHPQEEFLETLTNTIALVIPLTVILASSGGYFLARRSLAPVAAMGLQAGRIRADNLHERLTVENAKDELGHLAQSFNSLLDRLNQAFDQQRRFVADASHELRTPVAILCGEADVTLSQSDRSPEEYRESLAILRAEAHRLKHLVERLFTLARADAGQHPLVLGDFYLDELVSEYDRNMRTLASAKNIAFDSDSHTETLIRVDEP